jgi:hypothetical protein
MAGWLAISAGTSSMADSARTSDRTKRQNRSVKTAGRLIVSCETRARGNTAESVQK